MSASNNVILRWLGRGVAFLTRSSARLLTGARSIWWGSKPSTAQRIYFANHNSHIDFILLWASLPRFMRQNTRPIAASDYWLKDGVRRFLIQDTFNGVTINRNREGQSDPLQPVKDALTNGFSIIFFPEGTRNLEDDVDLLEFKSGLFYLKEAFPDVELVPVWISNLRRVMPKGALIPVPLLSTVTFGAPLERKEGCPKAEYLQYAATELLKLKEVQE